MIFLNTRFKHVFGYRFFLCSGKRSIFLLVILKKKIEKQVIRRHTRLRETDDLAIWGAPVIKQQPPMPISSISTKVRLTMLRNHLYICYEEMILLGLQITEQKALPL